MNERQREYFRQKLLTWKEEILKETRETLAHLQAENENHPDLADRASSETDRAIELRARDRQRKLIAKIDSALSRLEDGKEAAGPGIEPPPSAASPEPRATRGEGKPVQQKSLYDSLEQEMASLLGRPAGKA